MAYDHTARALYRKLVALYPNGFRDRLGESMEQTFNDLLRERRAQSDGSFGFVLRTFIETAAGIIQEHLSDNMKHIATNPKSAALVGFLLILPFLFLNMVVARRMEPLFSLIRPGLHTSPHEYVLLAFVLLLIPVGAFIAIRPMLQRGSDGKRKFYLANGILAAILLLVFVLLSVGLGSEIYRCDVLQIPNCD